MSKSSIVTINGKRYDAVTGLPVAGSKPAVKLKPTHSAAVHAQAQRSQTLNRRVTKKPVASAKPLHKPGRSMDIARSNKIARFAPHPVAPAKPAVTAQPDIPARQHPIAAKAHAAHATPAKPVMAAKTAQTIKEEAIVAALAQPPVKVPKKSFFNRHPRMVTIITAGLVVAILGAYLTYVNLPSLSVRIASAQAGIDATYPEYRPDGYSLNGPVTFSDGEVTISFVANTGSTTFTIKQSQSSWDSSAVLDNIVKPKAGDKYITSQERGLTIYTYSGNAAWVNAGILYTIEGDAPLSGEQIRRIATSL